MQKHQVKIILLASFSFLILFLKNHLCKFPIPNMLKKKFLEYKNY